MRKPQNDLVLQRPHWDLHGFQIGDFVIDTEHDPKGQFPKEIIGISGRYKEDHIQFLDNSKESTWLFAEKFKKVDAA